MSTPNLKPRRESGSPPRAVPGLIAIVALSAAAAFSQGIRKNYTEMTTEEKNALVAAFQALGDPANGLLRDLANFHNDNFRADAGGIHQASTEAVNVFHAWHRYASFELEQRMQQINPHITLPYWDWTVNRSTTDPLWDDAFLGGFNARWGLNRSLGGGTLPTAADVASVQSLTSWWGPGGVSGSGYSQRVENATPVHNSPHIWVGGTMAGGRSPLDPIFWFHHNYVDRLWQVWEDQEAGFKTSHTKTTMPRYDGTYTRPDGVVLPAIDPDNLRDSRSLGVFYALGGWAFLNGYTVANRTRNPEQFTYRDMIRAINFTVPAGRRAALRSATGIELMNNVEVQSGGSLVLEVRATGSIVAKTGAEEMRDDPPQEPREPIVEAANQFSFRTEGGDARLSLEFPGWIPKVTDIVGEVWDMAGKRSVLRLLDVKGVYLINGLTFDLSGVETRGVHFFRVRAGQERFAGRVVLGTRK